VSRRGDVRRDATFGMVGSVRPSVGLSMESQSYAIVLVQYKYIPVPVGCRLECVGVGLPVECVG
jgi:hypothetical protein